MRPIGKPSFPLGDPSISVPCPDPKCGRKFPQKLSRLRASPKIVCAHCGVTIKVDPKRLNEGLAAADESGGPVPQAISKAFTL